MRFQQDDEEPVVPTEIASKQAFFFFSFCFFPVFVVQPIGRLFGPLVSACGWMRVRNVEAIDSCPTLQHKTRKLNYLSSFGENLGMLEVYNESKTTGRFRKAAVLITTFSF